MSEANIRHALQEVLRQAFRERLPVRTSISRTGAIDVSIDQGSRPERLIGHWVRGWPSDIRALLDSVGHPWPREHVVLAPRFSPGAIALLESAGANWGEATGRGRIRSSGGLAISTADRESSLTKVQGSGALIWSPARADVAEILLVQRMVPRLEEMKRLTGWSVPQISQTLRAFDRQGWTARGGSARGVGATREVAGWEPLLESWAAYLTAAPRHGISAHATFRDPLSYVETTLGRAWKDLRWSASGWAGLQLTAPFVTSVPRLHLYVDAKQFHTALPLALGAAGLHEVSEGARVEIWPAREAAFVGSADRRPGVRVVHGTRLYADLLALGDRGREAALHVREEVLDRG